MVVQLVKNSPANEGDARDEGLSPGLGRSPGGGKRQPTPVFLPGKVHGQRSLAGHSPRSRKESDTTEHIHTCTTVLSIHTYTSK